ncbi:MAG: PTS sugar transporter subunit IIB [Candidatus Dadabacteria bacterium]|nr:PTS sugar transporter subunit IIB [Candidatus Dadabacteria bacterium]
MGIVLVRVDSRLVHGQILEAWIPYTKAEALIVIDDEVQGNLLKRSVMEMAVPSSIEIDFSSISDAIRRYKNSGFSSKKRIVLFSSIQDAKAAFDGGFRYDSLNLGNMHFCEGKVQVSSNLWVGIDDTAEIEELSREGVSIDTRSVPGERKLELSCIFKKVRSR